MNHKEKIHLIKKYQLVSFELSQTKKNSITFTQKFSKIIRNIQLYTYTHITHKTTYIYIKYTHIHIRNSHSSSTKRCSSKTQQVRFIVSKI